MIRVYVAFLSAGQVLFERYGLDADPWMTLVGYFNSLRELGGMRRLVDDDVRTRLRKMADRGLANRTLYTPDTVKELTSRLGSAAIPETLDLLESRFDPAMLDRRKEPRRAGSGEYMPGTARRTARHEHDLGRRGRATLGPDGRGRSAEDDGGIYPGHQPCRS